MTPWPKELRRRGVARDADVTRHHVRRCCMNIPSVLRFVPAPERRWHLMPLPFSPASNAIVRPRRRG
jgi:hypothetical protein